MNSISIMIKPSSSLCNLACEYCFYHDIADNRKIKNSGLMTVKTMQNVIDNAFKYTDGGDIFFTFQGGEPLIIGLEFYQLFIKYVNDNNIKNSKINYALQTNGVLIDKEWCEFFKTNNFLIGVSLDGHLFANKNRIDTNGNSTFSRVIDATKKLKQYQVEFNILTVVTSYVAQNIEEIYNFFKRKDFKFLQFIPCMRKLDNNSDNVSFVKHENMYMSSKEYLSFLTILFKLYYKDFIDGNYVSIRYFDNILSVLRTGSGEQCGLNGKCNSSFVIEGDGNAYPCDFYCLDEYEIGNINKNDFTDFSTNIIMKEFVKPQTTSACFVCKYAKLCNNSCKRQPKEYCRSLIDFFEQTLPYFKMMLTK